MSKAHLHVRVDETVWAAAQAEAERRGSAVDDVVEEALRRYTAAEDLGRLTAALRRRAEQDPARLTDEQATAIAAEELAASRSHQAR